MEKMLLCYLLFLNLLKAQISDFYIFIHSFFCESGVFWPAGLCYGLRALCGLSSTEGLAGDNDDNV